jgi:hypothetical protein
MTIRIRDITPRACVVVNSFVSAVSVGRDGFLIRIAEEAEILLHGNSFRRRGSFLILGAGRQDLALRYSRLFIHRCGIGFVLPREGLEPAFPLRLLALVVPGQGVAGLTEGLFLSGKSTSGSRESGRSGRARAAARCR